MARKTRATRQQNYYGDFEPVQRIELSGKHLKLRAAVAVLFAVVGIFFLAKWAIGLFRSDPGVRRIEVLSKSDAAAYAAEFALSYNIGQAGLSATAENKQLTALYTQLLEEAKEKYSLEALNAAPGKAVEVSKEMYAALGKLADAGEPAERIIFLAPAYEMYSSVFFSQSDEEAAKADPYKNADAAKALAELAEYFSDPSHVRIELEGGSKARLVVSDAYMAYAKQHGMEAFADLAWLENALIVDYVSDGLIAQGFRLGSFASYDGYSRNFGETEGYAQAFIKTGPTVEYDRAHYYVYADGTVRHCWLQTATGRCAQIPADFGEKRAGAENSCFEVIIGLAKSLLK